LEWREVGAPTWNIVPNATTPYNLSNLTACTDYEFQLQGECANDTSDYSLILPFKTDGCCEPPLTLSATNATDTTASLIWGSVLAANSYNLRWRAISAATWTSITGAASPYAISMLSPCTTYEFEVQTACMNGTITVWSSTINFSTTCGPCTANNYCPSNASDSSYEWIEEVDINGISNISGDNGGYFGFFETPFDLKQNDTTNLILTPGFSGSTYDEVWMIYIDYDQNGVFDNSELAFNSTVSSTPINGFLIVPPTALLGYTRMRIQMHWDTPLTSACEVDFDYGEVEDYCVNITPGCEPAFGLAANTSGAPGTAELSWNLNPSALNYNLQYRPVGTNFWINLPAVGPPPYTLNNLPNCVDQEFQVQSICQNDTSPYSASEVFSSCISSNDLPLGISNFYAPNPFDREITIFMNADQLTDLQFDLVSISGQVLESELVSITTKGEQQFTMQTKQDYPRGIYFLSLKSDHGVQVIKLLKN